MTNFKRRKFFLPAGLSVIGIFLGVVLWGVFNFSLSPLGKFFISESRKTEAIPVVPATPGKTTENQDGVFGKESADIFNFSESDQAFRKMIFKDETSERISVFDVTSKKLEANFDIKKFNPFQFKEWGKPTGHGEYWVKNDYQIVGDRLFFFDRETYRLSSVSLRDGTVFNSYPFDDDQSFGFLVSPNGNEVFWFKNVTPKSERDSYTEGNTRWYKVILELWHGNLDGTNQELLTEITNDRIWEDASPVAKAFFWKNNEVFFTIGSVWSPGLSIDYYKIDLSAKKQTVIEDGGRFYYFDNEGRRITLYSEKDPNISPSEYYSSNTWLILQGFDFEPVRIQLRNKSDAWYDLENAMVSVSSDKKKILYLDWRDLTSEYGWALYDVTERSSKELCFTSKTETREYGYKCGASMKFVTDDIIAVDQGTDGTALVGLDGQKIIDIPQLYFLGTTFF